MEVEELVVEVGAKEGTQSLGKHHLVLEAILTHFLTVNYSQCGFKLNSTTFFSHFFTVT